MTLAKSTAESLYQQGDKAHDQRNYSLAEKLLRSALALDPGHWKAKYTLAVLLQDLGRHGDAAPLYAVLLASDPHHAKALNNYAVALQYSGSREQAIAVYRSAVEAAPTNLNAVANLSGLLADTGREDEAISVLSPYCDNESPNVLDLRRALIFPAIANAGDQLRARRSEVLKELRRIERKPPRLLNPLREIGRTPFYLPYQPESDRELLETLASIYRQACPELMFVAPHCVQRAESGRVRRRIVFASFFFFDHSVARVMLGLIEKLPRDRFEVIAVFLGGKFDDDWARSIAQVADSAIETPYDIFESQRLIAGLEPDILCFSDFGMDPMSYFLGFSRLAPVQCTTWGHVETSGLDSIDWFVSTEGWEGPDADQDYTERLFRIPDVASPAYYRKPQITGAGRSRIPPECSGPNYVCFQVLYKLHPDFDAVIAAILGAQPGARLYLVRSQEPVWNAAMAARLERNLGATVEQVIWLDPMDREDYQATLAACDVVLDPLHFSGGNTSLEAFAACKPVVTMQGRIMRARFTAGFYRAMGLADLITESPAEYVALATRLGRDAGFRNEVAQRIAGRSGVLFEDARVIERWTDFLDSVRPAN
jgi:predicted O-linked N-acetylglucosamine transferase (SPINDLY family)